MEKWQVWEEEFFIGKDNVFSEKHKLGLFATEEEADNAIAKLEETQKRYSNPKQYCTYSKKPVWKAD